MSPVLHVCPVSLCGRLTSGGRCETHKREDNARRHRKQQQHGRNSDHWRTLRLAARERDGFRCRRCGSDENLTGHLDPKLEGDHLAATLDDVLTLCRSCHGSVDAARSRPSDVEKSARGGSPRLQ